MELLRVSKPFRDIRDHDFFARVVKATLSANEPDKLSWNRPNFIPALRCRSGTPSDAIRSAGHDDDNRNT
jgi:hypothetical protein